jgi:hypothetical protein
MTSILQFPPIIAKLEQFLEKYKSQVTLLHGTVDEDCPCMELSR